MIFQKKQSIGAAFFRFDSKNLKKVLDKVCSVEYNVSK